MKNRLLRIAVMIFTAFPAILSAQPKGNIRGTVTDAASGRNLPFVTVIVLNTNPSVGAVTDERGEFSLPPLPVGRYDVQASFLGYETGTMREIMVSSARETVMEISLKESVQTMDDVVITPRTNKDMPLNSMALTGARTLTVEEASRYAGGMEDPARLVTSFAGTAGSVSGNSIAIRGNSPQSMQWKLEGIEIPNPNHYPELSSVGGGILTAFSSRVLGNSDFFTGAFPAQYNNALSGVFDMMLRNGNNQRFEHTAQVGTVGLEFASEGPFEKGKGSYLFNYRYSTLALAGDLIGGAMEEVAGTKYQDLSFKINLPTRKAGTFTLWGIGAIDGLTEPLSDDPAKETSAPTSDDSKQYMGSAGLGHRIFLSPNTYLKTTIAATYAQSHIKSDLYNDAGQFVMRYIDLRDNNTNLIFNTYLNTKTSARHTNRTGVTVTGIFYGDDYNISPGGFYPTGPMVNFADTKGNSLMVSAFSQSLFQWNERLSSELGVNAQYFALNGHWTIEPRASIRWQAAPRHALALAAGMHSRRERLDYYFVTTPETGDRLVNKDLDFTKAVHIVMSYDWHITDNLHFRLEPYYQHLYNIPVMPGTGRTILNQTDFFMNERLAATGIGRNFGVDMTFERYLKGGYYYMVTASLFDSKYRGDDGVWHNTRYNRHYIVNALGGKEWLLGRKKQHVLGVNLRLNVMGGSYYTPLDEAASLTQERPVEDDSRIMGNQNPADFVVHLTLNWQVHRPKVTHEVGFQMMNVTFNKEFFGFDTIVWNTRCRKRIRRSACPTSITG